MPTSPLTAPSTAALTSSTTAAASLSKVASVGSTSTTALSPCSGADDGQLDAVDAASRVGRGLRVAGRYEDLDGGEDSGPDPAVGQGLQGVVSRATLRQRLEARPWSDLEAEHRGDEQGEHHHGHGRGDEAVPDDEPRPCRPAARCCAFLADAGVVDARTDARQQRGQQRQDDGHADQRDQHAREPHAAQGRHRDDEQGEQADRDGDAGGERRRDRPSSSRRRRHPRCCVRARAPRAIATPGAASSRSPHRARSGR